MRSCCQCVVLLVVCSYSGALLWMKYTGLVRARGLNESDCVRLAVRFGAFALVPVNLW